jgi:hypothetical protein
MGHPLVSMQSNTTQVMVAETSLSEQLIALLPNDVIGVNGTMVPCAAMVAQLQGHLATLQQIEALRVQLGLLVVQAQTERIAVKASVAGLETYVTSRYGTSSPVYGALGFVAKKRGVMSVAVSAAAVEKRLATRKKRHTMGKRQRAAIPPAAAGLGPRASGLGQRPAEKEETVPKPGDRRD